MRESYDALVDSFKSIDNLLSRFKIYAMIAMVIIGCAGSRDEYVDSGGNILGLVSH